MPRWELACLSRQFTCWNWQLAGTLAGFLGACLRLAGSTDLGARYLTATADQQPALLTSYLDLQRLVNTSFSAGGVVAGAALGLAASIAWQTTEFPARRPS